MLREAAMRMVNWGLAALGGALGLALIGPAACPADGGALCTILAGVGCAAGAAAAGMLALLRKR